MTKKIKKSEVDFFREKFVVEYSRKKGWNSNELSISQMMEIISKEDYKNPKINI